MNRHCFLIVIVLLFLNCTSWAQERWLYPPSELSPELSATLEKAYRFVYRQDFEAARGIYLRLADENAGTSVGAGCLDSARMTYIYEGDASGIAEMEQRIIAEYPGSRFAIKSRFSIVEDQNFNAGFEEKISAYSDFLEEMGAPRLEGIRAGHAIPQATLQIGALHPETRFALAWVYNSCFRLVEDSQEAFNIAKFCRAAFGATRPDNVGFETSFRSSLKEWKGQDIGGEPSRPTIVIVSPAPNSTVPGGSAISFTLSSGDYRKDQVRLDGLSIMVDGVEVGYNAIVSSEIDESLSEGVNFETVTVMLKPELALGAHSVEVSAFAALGKPTPENSATKSWSFFVSGDGDGDGDGGEDTALITSRDTLLTARDPHRNEGANPILTLEKIQGKASRCAVGFNLADVDLNGLTRARLKLAVDPNEQVNGWGNGDTISVLPLTSNWVEGNGQSFGLKKKDQVSGNGSGVTWFSPVDEDISNDYANSTVQWNGGFTATPTSTPFVMTNHYSGAVEFDVTQDLLNGQGQYGWLVRKDQENRGSKVHFFSREGAAQAGDNDLAPTLILEYGEQVSSTNSLGEAGEILQKRAITARAGEWLLTSFADKNPLSILAITIAYRTWLNNSLNLARVAQVTT